MGIKDWSFRKKDKLTDRWPKMDNGEFYPPAFLKHISGNALETDLVINLLDAYGIPSISEYPNDGAFGKLIIGRAAAGIDLYVPENMLEDAQNLLSSEAVIENDEEQE